MKSVDVTFSDKANAIIEIKYVQFEQSIRVSKTRNVMLSRVTEEVSWKYRQDEMIEAWKYFIELQTKQLNKGWEVVNTFIYSN